MKQSVMNRNGRSAEVVGALGVVGIALAALTLRRSRLNTRQPDPDEKRAALAAYLRDHLAGADTAIQVVERLKVSHHGTREGVLFASLHQQFQEERAVVRALLTNLGASPLSVKRFAGRATGHVIKAVSGGKRGELPLFRTLEGLAVGVQGKRCLWRAAQVLAPSLRAPGRRSFVELESDAVDQWEAIEQYRLSHVPLTFAL